MLLCGPDLRAYSRDWRSRCLISGVCLLAFVIRLAFLRLGSEATTLIRLRPTDGHWYACGEILRDEQAGPPGESVKQ
jgi:hypothetical protein